MPEPYLGEIRLMAFNYAPSTWVPCNGQLLATSTNQALFSLIGTTYGGNGTTTFALPNLQGKVPIHAGTGFYIGQSAGESLHTLTLLEIPNHTHMMKAKDAQSANPGPDKVPSPTVSLAQAIAAGGTGPVVPVSIYGTGAIDQSQTFARGAVANAGQNQGHENRQPFLVINFCIALQGIFPSRN